MVQFHSLPPILTRRERQVLSATLDGLTREEIAQLLSVSPETIKAITRKLLAKFEAVSLRDGLKNMIAYEEMFGLTGVGHKRFATSNNFHIRIDPNRKDATVTMDIEYKILVDGFDGWTGLYYKFGGFQDVQYSGVTVSRHTESKDCHYFEISVDPPLRKNQTLAFQAVSRHIGIYTAQKGVDVHRNSVPCSAKTFVYEFPENDVPQNIAAILYFGGDVVGQDAIERRQHGNIITFHVQPLLMNSRFEARWTW